MSTDYSPTSTQTAGPDRKIVTAETKHLGNLLDQLVETAGKGVHAKVSKTDAHRIVIYTYLALGDILML